MISKSGGPLIQYNQNKWILIGIVSFVGGEYMDNRTESQCNPLEPSFHTKVPNYIKWIQSNIKFK